MNRTLRNVLCAAGVIAIVACSVDIAFDIPKDFVVDATGSTVNTVVAVDLSSIQAVQDHKTSVQALSLGSVDATVTAVATANKATSVSGTMSLRPSTATDSSQDVPVGTLSNFPIAVGSKVTLPGNPTLDAFMLARLKDNGTFNAAIVGTTAGGEAHLTVHAVLHASMTYGSGGPL